MKKRKAVMETNSCASLKLAGNPFMTKTKDVEVPDRTSEHWNLRTSKLLRLIFSFTSDMASKTALRKPPNQ